MKKSTIIIGMLLLVSIITFGSFTQVSAKSKDDDKSIKEKLTELINDTIDRDSDKFENLSPYLKKAYNKLVDAFKSLGKLSKDVTKVVKMYNELDENADDYPDKLQEFFKAYNKLGVIKRKLVDFCTGFLNAKDKLLTSVKYMENVDMYSTKVITPDLTGNLTYTPDNTSIINVDSNGKITAVGLGYSKLIVSNGTDEIVYRIFVKSPVFATKASVKVNKSIKITISDKYTITSAYLTNKYIK